MPVSVHNATCTLKYPHPTPIKSFTPLEGDKIFTGDGWKFSAVPNKDLLPVKTPPPRLPPIQYNQWETLSSLWKSGLSLKTILPFFSVNRPIFNRKSPFSRQRAHLPIKRLLFLKIENWPFCITNNPFSTENCNFSLKKVLLFIINGPFSLRGASFSQKCALSL